MKMRKSLICSKKDFYCKKMVSTEKALKRRKSKMINFTKVFWKMENKMEKGFFIIIMGINMLVIGKIICFMDWEYIYFPKERDSRGS